MNSKEVYMNIFQVLAGKGMPQPEEFGRNLVVHVSRASAGNISHVTLEFEAQRAMFFSCIMFDGSGDQGCGLVNYAMPKIVLTPEQRALLLLTCLEYLISAKLIDAKIMYFKSRISHEIKGGASDILAKYTKICHNSWNYINAVEAECATSAHVDAATAASAQ